MSATQTIDYDALAKQAGAISSQPQSASTPASGVDYDALAKQAGAISSQPASSATSSPTLWDEFTAVPRAAAKAYGDYTVGFAKGAGDTVSGVAHLINKIPGIGETLSPKEGIGALDQMDKSSNTTQSVGKGVESIAEFAVGDEALSGLAKGAKLVELADKYPIIAKTLNLATAHPWLAKMITESAKGAAVGGAQGLVKGAQQNNAVSGATGGAIGGGVGGAVGSAAGPLTEKVGSLLKTAAQGSGIGLEPADALVRAIKPTGNLTSKFPESAELALPRLQAAHAASPITNLDELSDAAHSQAQNLWSKEIVPQIQKHANETIVGKPIADAIRGGVSAGDKDLFEGASDAAERLAKKFDGDMTLQQASDRLQSLNRKVASLYKLDPASRYAATAGNSSLEAMEDAANSLRGSIYDKLESLGEKDPAGLRKQYGALKDVERAADKRAIVYGRQNPLNLSQVISAAGGAGEAAGALFSGHPVAALAGAIPPIVASIAKKLNAPEHLIQSALEESISEGAFSQFFNAAANAAKTAGPKVGTNLGAQTGQAAENGEEQ